MKYAAFLRGIGPENPNMHGAKLKEFFERVGFKNVQTLLSSGNVIFETELKDGKRIEKLIEENLPKVLGFARMAFVRSQTQIQKLIDSKPFGKTLDTPISRLNVTFLKDGGYEFSVIDTVNSKTPEVMRILSKKYGEKMTMRTWKTVNRVFAKMSN